MHLSMHLCTPIAYALIICTHMHAPKNFFYNMCLVCAPRGRIYINHITLNSKRRTLNLTVFPVLGHMLLIAIRRLALQFLHRSIRYFISDVISCAWCGLATEMYSNSTKKDPKLFFFISSLPFVFSHWLPNLLSVRLTVCLTSD